MSVWNSGFASMITMYEFCGAKIVETCRVPYAV